MRLLRSAALLAAAVLFALPAAAADRIWTGAVDDKWSTAGNWNPSGTPLAGDNLEFTDGASRRTTTNDLDVVLGEVRLSATAAYAITGNTVRVRDGIRASSCSHTVGSAQITGANATLNAAVAALDVPAGAKANWTICGTYTGALTGAGTINAWGTIDGAAKTFSGQLRNDLGPLTIDADLRHASFSSTGFTLLSGSGRIGDATISSELRPGGFDSLGVFRTGNLDLTNADMLGTRVLFDLGAGGYDVIDATGTVTIRQKTLDLQLASGFTPRFGDRYTIIRNDGTDPVSGVFRGGPQSSGALNEGAVVTSGQWAFRISYRGGDGNDVELRPVIRGFVEVGTSPRPSIVGQPVTISARVVTQMAGAPPATGTVTFYLRQEDDMVPVATVPLDENGRATYTHTFTRRYNIQEDNINVTYSGDENYVPGSGRARQTVDGIPSQVTATHRSRGAREGTVNVTVRPANGAEIPTGTVRLLSGTTSLSTATLDATGSATLPYSNLDNGTQTLTVRYDGDGKFAAGATQVNVDVSSNEPRVSNLRTAEGNEARMLAHVIVTLASPAAEQATVNYRTADRSARSGEDYEAVSGTLVFGAGDVEKRIAIPILGDTAPEGDEELVLEFSAGRNMTAPADAVVTITNDDSYFRTLSDLIYATVGEQALTLDLRLPNFGSGPFPLILLVDAPDWSTPRPHSDAADFLAARGYAVASAGFRSSAAAPFPAQLDDLRTAIRWLREHAGEHAIDPARVGVWGIGAGGHLAALLGTTGGVQAVVDWYGPIDLAALQSDATACANHSDASSPAAILLGCPPAACPTTAAAANPIAFVDRGDAPFLIMHGSFDCEVPAAQSRMLYDALRAAGNEVTLTMVAAGRGGTAWRDAALLSAVEHFFDQHLRNRMARRRTSR